MSLRKYRSFLAVPAFHEASYYYYANVEVRQSARSILLAMSRRPSTSIDFSGIKRGLLQVFYPTEWLYWVLDRAFVLEILISSSGSESTPWSPG